MIGFSVPWAGAPGTFGAQYRAPLVKSEFFFLCIFSISLRRRELSESHSYFTMPGPRAIYSSERFSRNVLSSSKKWPVTSRHVTFCDSQFIQQQEDTQWVLRTTMGEIVILIKAPNIQLSLQFVYK